MRSSNKLSALFLLFILDISRKEHVNSEMIFSNFAGENTKLISTLITSAITVTSDIECVRLCDSYEGCQSVNIMDILGKKICELLGEIPLDPSSITDLHGSKYWEKTCQPFLGLTSSNSDNKLFETVVATDGGVHVYKVLFDQAFNVINMTFWVPPGLTDGPGQNIVHSVTMRKLNISTTWLMFGNGLVTCSLDDHPCSEEWPKPIHELFFDHSIWAVLAKHAGNGLYVFSYDRVMEVSVDFFYVWSIVSTHMLSDPDEDNKWSNVPHGIVAASWISDNPSPGVNPTKAFLATRDFYIIFDTINQEIIKRGHLCYS